ncbi:hypothetical protein KCU67_g13441, partial [Aureobasidium melanogenum]
GAWGYDLFQSDTDLDTVEMLDDAADLNEVKKKIIADRARYSFKSEEKEEASNKDADTDTEDNDIYMTLYNPSHPVSID